MRLHFLGIGAQRCGTTSLHAWLARQPQLCLPQGKELHYFSHHYSRGECWYASQFRPNSPRDLIGEITPYYLFHPLAPKRIRDQAPNARLIVLLRDPIDRLVSHYLHSVRFGFERLPLISALQAERYRLADAEQVLIQPGRRHVAHQEQSYLARSRYQIQLRRYYALFPPEQILLLRSEDLFAKPADGLMRLADFLGFQPRSDQLMLPRMGSTRRYQLSDQLRSELRADLAETYQVMSARYQMTWD